MKRILIFILFLGVTILVHGQISPQDMVVAMGRGINLGNTMSAPVEGNWQPAVQESYFEDVVEAGFTTVRIPMDFFGVRTTGDTSVYSKDAGTSGSYTGNPSDYVVDASYLDRVEEVITWSLDQDLITILDFHGSTLKSEYLYTHSPKSKWAAYYTHPTSAKRMADEEKFRAIWSAIANRLKAYSYNLLFEVVNEPYFFMTATEMDILNLDIIGIIRASGSKNTDRNILITGGSENSYEAPLQIGADVLNSDAYLIATYHYYHPRDFTASSHEDHNDFDWGTAADKATVDNDFNVVLDWSQNNNMPIHFGEFGSDNEGGYDYHDGVYGDFGGPEEASRIAYHEYLAQKAIDLGFSFTVWDAGDKSNKTIYIVSDRSWVENIKDAVLGENLSTEEVSIINDLIVYPNPVNELLYLRGSKKIESIELFDLKGIAYRVKCKKNIVNLLHINQGLYIAEITFSDKTAINRKILIQK